MKAVITKIVKNNAIVLKIDGSFECIPDKGYIVGQEIYLSDKKTNGFNKFIIMTLNLTFVTAFKLKNEERNIQFIEG